MEICKYAIYYCCYLEPIKTGSSGNEFLYVSFFDHFMFMCKGNISVPPLRLLAAAVRDLVQSSYMVSFPVPLVISQWH